MRYLKELVQKINLSKLKANGLIEAVFEPGTKMEQLYELIFSGKIDSDEEALALLYPSDSEQIKYQSLKNKLKERLVDTVFLLDFKDAGFTNRQVAYWECSKRWASANILLSKSAKLNGIYLLETLLKHSIHFEFTELTLNILNRLRLHYGTVEGDQKKYEQYREMYHAYRAIWLMEEESEDLYVELTNHFVNSKAAKEELSAKAGEMFAQIAPYLEKSSSFRLHLCGRLLQMYIYTCRNDYTSTSQLCEDAITFFESKPYQSSLPIQAFYYQLAICYTQLRQFDKGKAAIEKYQSLIEEGSFNWFKFQELYLILAMHTARYDEAVAVCERVLCHPRLSHQPAQIQEMWKIFEAYVQYLVMIGKVSPGALTGKFKKGKFLNEIPVFSKDKRGMNIPVLIIQILFSLMEKDYKNTVDRIDAIEKYCARYLKPNDTFRSSCLIKMLLQLPLSGFHREAVRRKTLALFNRLKHAPPSDQAPEVEIIPYEDLWEMTLMSLSLQIYRVPKSKDKPAITHKESETTA